MRYRIEKAMMGGDERKPWPAVLGDGNGTVTVPGNPQLCYARPGGMALPVIIHNSSTPHTNNLPVWIGRDPYDKAFTRVLNVRFLDGLEWPENPQVGPHASSHQAGGSDLVYIGLAQITPLLAYVSDDLEVTINPGHYIAASGAVVRIEKTAVDMSSHEPASGACWNLIRADDAGAIDVVDGTPVDDIADLTLATDAPALAAGYKALAYVRQYVDQVELSSEYAAPDVIPAAFWMGSLEAVAHKTSHEDGGADEISVEGLSGTLADVQDAGWLQGVEVDDSSPSDNQILRFDDGNSKITWETPPWATAFTELDDAPNTYADGGGKVVKVKVDESGLEFVAGGAGVDSFNDLDDVPASYVGQAGKVPVVNATEDGLEYSAAAGAPSWVKVYSRNTFS